MRAFAHRDPTAAKVLYEWFSSRIYGLAIVMLGTDEAGCGFSAVPVRSACARLAILRGVG
jgi:hypothetical protein